MAAEPDASGEEIQLDHGMPVASLQGERLGELASVLVDEDTEEAFFIIVSEAGADSYRLVPFEAIAEVEDGTVLLDVEPEDFERLPRASPDRDPTDAEMELAYRVLGLEDALYED